MMWRERDLYDDWNQTDHGLYVPAGIESGLAANVLIRDAPIGVDLFAGAGGFSCGFHQAGWDVQAASDNDVDATLTYLCNLGGPDTRLIFLTDDDERAWDKAMNRK